MARKGPNVLQAFLIILSGAALAFFGCLGGLAAMNNSSLANIGIIAVFIGIMIFMVGGLLLAIRILTAIWQTVRGRGTTDSSGGA